MFLYKGFILLKETKYVHSAFTSTQLIWLLIHNWVLFFLNFGCLLVSLVFFKILPVLTVYLKLKGILGNTWTSLFLGSKDPRTPWISLFLRKTSALQTWPPLPYPKPPLSRGIVQSRWPQSACEPEKLRGELLLPSGTIFPTAAQKQAALGDCTSQTMATCWHCSL